MEEDLSKSPKKKHFEEKGVIWNAKKNIPLRRVGWKKT